MDLCLQEDHLQLESERVKVLASKEELDGRCEKLSRQLAEARQREKQRRDSQGRETEKLQRELEALRMETGRLQEREEKVCECWLEDKKN